MQVKFIVAAISAIAATGAQAVVIDPTATSPDVTVYVTGASAQKASFAASVATGVCAVPTDVVKLIDNAGTGSDGWYCKGKGTAANKNVLVINRSKGGSGAGVNQVLSTAFNEAEAETIDFATCGSFDATAKTAVCTGKKKIESTMALSDVKATEYAAGILGSGAGYIAPSSLTTAAVGLQGFGVIVNPAMYTALQEQNVADGLLEAACVGQATAACQPSISSADYTSVVSVSGQTKDAASLVPAASVAGDLTVCRRVDTSGTQAAANLFFLNNVCGSKGFGGAEVPATSADYPGLIVENSETSDVKACVNNASGLRMGVVSLENVPKAADSYKFVKLDGVSPNFTAAGAPDAKQRTNLRNGTYKFGIEAYAMWKGTPIEKAVAKQLADTMKASTTDLVGLLSFAGGTGPTSALYKRGGNNCAPLLKR